MKTFLTEKEGFEAEPIEALDFGHAQQIAWGLGVEVIGEHILTIQREGFTEEDANRMCKDLLDTYGRKPPERK